MKTEKIGEFIYKKRKAAGLSAKKLGSKTNVSGSYIRFIEEGKRNPTFDVVAGLISALDVEWDEFLTATGYKKIHGKDDPWGGNQGPVGRG